ncbi:MAG: Fur family transcriptional regulator [Salaquimonas sp.]
MSNTANQRDYEGELRKEGIRITKPRKVILKILTEMNDHPDAMEIFRRAVKVDESISLATVYRTMKLLEGLGAVHRHSFEGGPARFENADGEHHDHLIDLDTGKVVEFHSETIERLQQQIADELGYDIEHHRLELYGRKRK